MLQGETDRQIELTGDVHDRLLSYQRNDETLQDTPERVVLAFLPHAVTLEDAGIDREQFNEENRVIVERWPDDTRTRTFVYGSKTAYLRANKTVIEHTNLEPGESEGDA